jgi:hypothetical protein
MGLLALIALRDSKSAGPAFHANSATEEVQTDRPRSRRLSTMKAPKVTEMTRILRDPHGIVLQPFGFQLEPDQRLAQRS